MPADLYAIKVQGADGSANTVTTSAGGGGAATQIEGITQIDSAYADRPVVGGARASAATPTAVSADGDVQALWSDLNGRLRTLAEQQGTWAVAATQSGAWAVAATQSGAWSVTVTGTPSVTISGTPSVTISGTPTVDTELPAAAALADATANPTAPAVGSFPHVWNGATWDRMPGTAANGVTFTGKVQGDTAHDAVDAGNPVKIGGKVSGSEPTAVGAGDRVDAMFDSRGRLQVGCVTLVAPADGYATVGGLSNISLQTALLGSSQYHYNGASHDRTRGNIDASPINSGARTVSTNGADVTNYNAKGVIVVFDVTVVPGVDTVQLLIQGKDFSSSKYYDLLTATAVLATGTYVYIVYPGAVAAADGVTKSNGFLLPRIWRVRVVHSAATSFTYSVGTSMIV